MGSSQERNAPQGWPPEGYTVANYETAGQAMPRRWAAVYPDGTEGPRRLTYAAALVDCQLYAIKRG